MIAAGEVDVTTAVQRAGGTFGARMTVALLLAFAEQKALAMWLAAFAAKVVQICRGTPEIVNGRLAYVDVPGDGACSRSPCPGRRSPSS